MKLRLEVRQVEWFNGLELEGYAATRSAHAVRSHAQDTLMEARFRVSPTSHPEIVRLSRRAFPRFAGSSFAVVLTNMALNLNARPGAGARYCFVQIGSEIVAEVKPGKWTVRQLGEVQMRRGVLCIMECSGELTAFVHPDDGGIVGR